ncbi:hypothetical protein AM593_02394, partial [Mytilus galloprovincialis]
MNASLNRASAVQSGSVNNPQSVQNFQESTPMPRDSINRASSGGPYTIQSGSVSNPQSVQVRIIQALHNQQSHSPVCIRTMKANHNCRFSSIS